MSQTRIAYNNGYLKMSKTDVSAYVDLPYEVEIKPENYEDGRTCYVASHPELPGCMSHGDTEAEAVASLREARELYIGSLIEDGLEVPEPVAPVPEAVAVADGAGPHLGLMRRRPAQKSRRR
jgi:predicted RNase H-like HicB family nuclease